ncbi:MAG TPA: beta-ketoacyl synthase N-terminal-like domain-containing protein [Actinocrinis sp.]|nr:beta-ketoacyl synthase N-terminal-like domain-containing protein [Actinocrinis sp.]
MQDDRAGRPGELPGPDDAHDIAIIGAGLRFPGGVRSLDALWRTIHDGVDVTGEIPADRWGPQFHHPDPRHPGTTYCPKGAFLGDIDRFDADFFGISPREARELDPQQRILLETSWAAMEDSGIPREQWEGSRTGVFAGVLAMDYTVLHAKTAGVESINPYYASGKEFSFGVGRIAYTFGLHGPCLMLNTACSSSLMAVHLASQALRNGECDAALAGGVNLMLVPELSIFMSKIDALSPTGVCRPFDASADGVVRGEGCGVIVLKRYDDAVEAGDRILAVVKGSATNHDGRSAGLTAPNAAAQALLLRSALGNAGLEPGEVDYVEAHGTGTPLGDPMEIGALSEVIGAGRPAERPLLIGSHKANFGHLDSAAGLLGLLKAVLVARHGIVPPQIHFERPTPVLDWKRSGVRVPTEPTPLPGNGPWIAGVSAFGLSGSNVHVVVSSPPALRGAPRTAKDLAAHEAAALGTPTSNPVQGRAAVTARETVPVLVMSGPSAKAVADQAAAHRDLLRASDDGDLPDLFYSASVRRTHHDYRLAVVGRTGAELADAVDAHLAGENRAGTASGDVLDRRPPRIVHVFSGQGSQWPGMAMDLYRTEPLVRGVLDECDALIREHTDWSLLEELARTEHSRLMETRIAQPAVFAVQLALTRLWTSWGVSPDAVVGHSMGEIAAACAAGALSVPDATKLIVHRGRIMQDATGSGRMTAIELPADEVRTALEDQGSPLVVATVNGPRSTVIAGPADAMEDAVARFKAAGATCLPLGVDYAFHSPAVRRHGDELEDLLSGLVPDTPVLPLLSSVDPEADTPVPDASYWGRNVRDAVLFWPAVDRLLAKRDAVFVEIGPHPTLSRPVQAALAHRGRRGPVVASLARGKASRSTLAASLGSLYAAGISVDWSAVHGPAEARRYIKLPALELTGESYWLTGVERGRQGGAAAAAAEGLRAEVRLYDSQGRLVATAGGETRPADGEQAGQAPAAVAQAVTPAAAYCPTPAATAPAVEPAVVAAPVPALNGSNGASGAHKVNGAAPMTAAYAEAAAWAATLPRTEAPDRSPRPGRLSREQVARKITSAVAQILGHDPGKRISRVRGFYELGFDSFTIVDLVKQLQADFGVELGESAGIDHPTIDRMTDYLVAATAARQPAETAAGPDPDGTESVPESVPLGGTASGGTVGAAEPSPVVAAVTPPAAAAAVPSTPEPIAIVGMSCRLPGANGLDEYWSLLRSGTDATRDVPEARWDADRLLAEGQVAPGTVVTRRGAFLDGVEQFDNAFFRVSSREAKSMDPQQRIFLEVAWEALEDAGVSADSLRGGQTGLFVGMNTTDYQQLVTRHVENVDLYYGTGNSFSGTAGRLSYFLGVRGPSLAVDTACSSSLAAVHLACQSLRSGESDVALAGGSNVIATPTVYLAMSAGGALAPDGRCKTFDASADGYGRGEGAGAVVLKTLARARADGDRVYAVIRGSAVNHNGASGGLTVPSAEAQEQVVKAALAQAALPGAEVDYIEAHGTGTVLGDAVELTALDRALGGGRSADRPLLVGSVKTNIGHLEAAAGVAGLIKTVLALHHGEIPAHLHYDNPTGQVAWNRLGLKVTARRTPWPQAQGEHLRTAGVSAFGFTGTNAHVVVSEPPGPRPERREAPSAARAFALPLSGASQPALAQAAERMRERLEAVSGDVISDVCHTAGARRAHLEHRLVVVGSSREDLIRALSRAAVSDEGAGLDAQSDAAEGLYRGDARPGEPVRYAMAYDDSVADLPWAWFAAEEPAFRAALDAIDAEAAALLGRSVRKALLGGAADPVATVAAQIALTALWRDHGVAPDAIAGRGSGEIAAAYAAGALTLRDAVLAASGVRGVRLSAEPATPLVLASLAENGLDLSGWTVPGGTAPTAWGGGSAEALADLGVEAVVDAGLGDCAPRIAANASDELAAIAVGGAPRADALVRATAALHVAGCVIGWAALTGGRGSLVGLPTYPWQHRRHWIDVPALAAPGDGTGPHADLGAPFTPFDKPALRYYPVRIAGRTTGGWIAAPKAAALALSVARDLVGDAALRLRGFALDAPLSDAADLAPGAGAQLVARRDAASWSLRLVAGAADGRTAGTVARATADRRGVAAAEPADLAELRERLTKQVPGGITEGEGPLLDVVAPEPADIVQAPRRRRERLATVKLGTGGTGRAPLPAGLLAAAVRLLGSCSSRRDAQPFAVAGIDEILLFEAPAQEALLHATAESADRGDVRILGTDGRVLAELRGVSFAPAGDLALDEAVRTRVADRLYRIAWQPAEQTPDAQPPAAAQPGKWLVCPAVPDAASAAAGLAVALRQAGADTLVAAPQSSSTAAWQQLIDQQTDPVGAVVLVGAEATEAGEEGGVQGGARGSVQNISALSEAALGVARVCADLAVRPNPPRLWIVTRGAQSPAGGAPASAQAALWGLGRALAMETPAAWGGLVDLDPDLGPDAAPEAVQYDDAAAWILRAQDADAQGPAEDEACLRGPDWYVPRLVHAPAPPRTLRPERCREDAWYLVAGAQGEADRPILDWLTGRGARRILLAGSGGTAADDYAARITPLLPEGVTVKTVQAGDAPAIDTASIDAASIDTASLEAALEGAPLGGVVIAPGATGIRPLAKAEPHHLAAELDHARLAVRVERAVRRQRPDFFLLLGSAAAAWGSVGMTCRGAVEGVLDAVAAARSAAGRPAVTLRWMPRADTGELGRRDRVLMEDSGLTPLAAEDVAEALDVAVRGGYTDACVASVDEPRYAAACRGLLDRGLLALLAADVASAGEAEEAPAGAAPRTPFAAELAALAPDLRAERMLELVLGHVVEVLGEGGGEVDPDQGFFELGMDSVMSLALKTRLDRGVGGDLPTTLTFEYPTTRALARHLLEQVARDDEPQPEAAAATGAPDPAESDASMADLLGADGDGLEDLSDDQLMERLMASLASSESLLGEGD